jgi:hypothetical protein
MHPLGARAEGLDARAEEVQQHFRSPWRLASGALLEEVSPTNHTSYGRRDAGGTQRPRVESGCEIGGGGYRVHRNLKPIL